MWLHVVLIAHIAVLGYWLGAELVINRTFRYVAWADAMPFAERDRLMDHVMDVDQHVRYALILQAGLGTGLAGSLGYLPGGTPLIVAATGAGIAWLALAEFAHRLRKSAAGDRLAAADRAVRYLAIAGLIAIPRWLTWKLLLFAGVIASGVAIRGQLVRYYVTWRKIGAQGSNDRYEREIRRTYVAATSILGMLWALIAGIVLFSVGKA